MGKLNIETIRCTSGINTQKITGFGNGELNELKSMEHYEAREKLLEVLDSRNDNLGSRWANGYGVYSLWFDNEAAYLNVGSSCD